MRPVAVPLRPAGRSRLRRAWRAAAPWIADTIGVLCLWAMLVVGLFFVGVYQ